ncbi:MAG: MFS transporter [Candidatus Saccharimonadales bacterium]
MCNIKRLHLVALLSGANFTATIFTLYLLANTISLQQVIISQIIYAVASFVGEIPSGMISDKFGHKKTVITGYATLMLSPIMMILAPSATTLYISQAFNGLAGSALSGSEEALYYDSYQEEGRPKQDFTKFFSRYSSLPILGFIIASIVSGILLQLFDSESYIPIYLLNLISSAATTIVAATLVSTKKELEVIEENPISLLRNSWKTVRSSKILFSLAMFGLLSLNGEYFLRQTYQPFFQQVGVLPLFMGVVLAVGSALNFLVVRYSYKLEKFMNLEHILLLHTLLQGFLFIALGMLGQPVGVVILFVLLFSMFNAQNPVVSDYVNSRIEPNRRATVLSTISFVRQIGQTLIRFVYAILLGYIGVAHSYKIQGFYLVLGGLLGYWLLVKCGCTYKIPRHEPAPLPTEVKQGGPFEL